MPSDRGKRPLIDASRRRAFALGTALALAAVITSAARADTVVWGGGNGTFSTGANWVGGSAPGSDDTALFGGWAPLTRTSWTVTASVGTNPSYAKDGDRDTQWTANTGQASGQYVIVNLGSSQSFRHITMDSTITSTDYPRAFDVYVSTNGSTWNSPVYSGTGSSALVSVTLPATETKQYIKIQLTGSSGNWWRIGELFVYGTSATELSRSGWSASASGTNGTDWASNAIDGDATTKWSPGFQAVNQWFTVDMGSARTFTRIDMESNPQPTDYPRGYDVYVSDNGFTWGSPIASQSPSTAYTSITFSAQTKRYIRVQLDNANGSYWWSLFEFKVYGTPANCTISSNATVAAMILENAVTVTKSSGIKLTTSGSYTQSAGTFSGGNSAITVGTSFNLSGGTFTSTSGTLDVGTTFNYTGGTFTHNSGTVLLSSTSNQSFSSGGATFNNLAINDSLAGYWRLDDNTGTAATDSSGYSNTATLTNGPVWTGTKPTLGFTNTSALTLDGTNDYLDVGTAVTATNAAFSACTWARFNSVSGYQTMISIDGNSISGFYLHNNSSNKFDLQMYNSDNTAGSYYIAQSTTTVTTGTWYHVCGVYTGSVARIYVNGVQEGSDVTVSGAFRATGHTIIGAGLYNGARVDYVNGVLDDVRIYSRALNNTEIYALYIGNQPGTALATQSVTGTVTVNGDLIIAGGVNLGTGTLNLGGDWWNYSGRFAATWWGGATVNLTGTSTTNFIRSGGQFLPDINITGTGKWTLTDDLDVDPNSAISLTTGSMDISTYALRTGGLTGGSGTLTASSGTVVLDGNGSQTMSVGSFNVLRVEDPSQTSLVAYWKFDEGTGNSSRDWTGTGYTGTFINSPLWSTTVPSTVEYYNSHSVLLDGTSDYVEAGSAVTPSNAALTACAWVRFNGTTGNQSIASIDGTNISGFYLKKDTNHKFTMQFFASDSTVAATVAATGTTTATTATWYHVCGVRTASVARIYVNGTQEGSDTTINASFNATGKTIIGASKWSGSRADYLNGYIDDVRVYNVALTTAQIKALAAGQYPGTGGTATYTLGASLTVGSTFSIDSGGLSTSSYTVNMANSDATKVSYVGAGTYTIGSGTNNFRGGLTVRNAGTLALTNSSGVAALGSGKVLTIDGTLDSSTAGVTPTIQSVSGNYTFTVGSSATATPVLNINGLAVKNTGVDGMYINTVAGSDTTFTQFDNIAFSSGSTSASSTYIRIYDTSLSLISSGNTFTFATAKPDYAVKVAGNGTGDGETRAIFGGTLCGSALCTTSNKLDDDSDNDGVGDTSNGTGDEGVAQFLRAAPNDLAGTIQGFPTAAFNWNDFSYWRTYVAYNNASGAVDRVYVRNSDGSAAGASYYWDLPSSVGEIIGTPRWTMVGAIHYVYVATSLGRVYRLIDNGTSLATDTTPWNTPYFHGSSATVSTPLAIDSTNIYWMGNDSAGSRKFFILTHGKVLTSAATSLPAGVVTDPTAAPALSTISSSDYLFAGMKGYISKLKISDQALTNWTQPTSVAINGRLSIGSGLVYAGDNLGKVFGVNSTTLATDWCYQDTTTHGSCTDGGNCTIQNIYVDLTFNYIMYGDQDGHFYVVSKNAGGTTCTGTSGAKLSGYPVQPAAGEAITTAPLFDNGIVFFGTSSGNVFAYNRRTVAGGTPTLLRTYKFGSAVSSIAFNANTNSSAGAYMVGTANGRLYFIDKVSDGDAYK